MVSLFSRQFRIGSAPLARWSGGRPGRAALLLVGLHVGAGLVCCLPWVVGLLPAFDDARWLIRVTAVVLVAVVCPGMMLWLGFWGTAGTAFQDGGEEYAETFTPRTGFALGWLRWAMQLVMVGLAVIGLGWAWIDARPFGLPGAEEVRSLPSRGEHVPAPPGWRLTAAEADNNDGVVEAGEGAYELTYDVPAPLSEDELREWLEGPGWKPALGQLVVTDCEPTLPSCTALAVPPRGGHAEYSVHVVGRADSVTGAGEVEVRLSYQRFHGHPGLDVSGATKDRTARLPVPADWLLDDARVQGEKTDGGEDVTLAYGVPRGFQRDDVEVWLRSDVWASPRSGKAFGALEVEKCSLDDSETTWWCRGHTVAPDVAYEGVAVGFDERDRTLLVTLERNG